MCLSVKCDAVWTTYVEVSKYANTTKKVCWNTTQFSCRMKPAVYSG